MRLSVGDLFMGAIYPGLLLSGLYFLYLLSIAIFAPHRMPPPARREAVPIGQALWSLVRDLLAPMLLILSVLGTIITGIATPTESAAIGAAGALVLAFVSGGLNFRALRDSLHDTCKTTAMIVFVMIGASIFSVVFRRLGGDGMIIDFFDIHESNPYFVLFIVMALIFVLGFFLDWVEITLVVVPIVAPVVAALDFGLPSDQVMIWFAIALAVNLQTSFLTPPFGYALFYLRGVAPDLPISTIYRGVTPFVIIQIIALLLVIFFPAIVLSLPMSMR
jgi:tripartite ATP-independent transporter DctM subunit